MKYFFPLLLAALLSSCKERAAGLSEKITDSDSMAINWFKGDGTMDTVTTVKIVTDKKWINQLANFAAAAVTNDPPCGYDGSLHFFKMDKVIQDIRFQFNKEACRQFEFILNGKAYSTALSTEAKQLLLSIK